MNSEKDPVGEVIWKYLINAGMTKAGVAGMMGNLHAESLLNPKALQPVDSVKEYNGTTYTEAVDNGVYSKEKFINDSAGYGLAQWTYSTRKKGLYEYAKSKGKSIGDLKTQLEYLIYELKTQYKYVFEILCTTDSIAFSTITVLTDFEKPADTSMPVKNKRVTNAQTFHMLFSDILINDDIDIDENDKGNEETQPLLTEGILMIIKEIKDNIWHKDSWRKYITESIDHYMNAINDFEDHLSIDKETYVREVTTHNEYVVASGDTLIKIANMYNTTPVEILEKNKEKYPEMSLNFIRVGWVLKI